MTLSALIRKRDTGNLATAIPAIPATQSKGEAATVARIATVAVANPTEEKTVPMTAEHERVIRAWLALIDERESSPGYADPPAIGELLDKARLDAVTRGYFVGRAEAELPSDDRIVCAECLNLTGQRCQAVWRGEIAADRNYEPAASIDLPRRCAGYAPRSDDPDRRHGRERWPGLLGKGEGYVPKRRRMGINPFTLHLHVIERGGWHGEDLRAEGNR